MTAPITFTWDGEQMVPLQRFRRLCDREFVVGQTYPLVIEEERSANSHRHYFAAINEAWKNLPEDVAAHFPTAESLRKRALIEAGYYHEEIIDCGTNEVAWNVAAFCGKRSDFALITVSGSLVLVRTAKSQSTRSMNKADFQASKTAVLEILAQMVGVSTDELGANADRAA